MIITLRIMIVRMLTCLKVGELIQIVFSKCTTDDCAKDSGQEFFAMILRLYIEFRSI